MEDWLTISEFAALVNRTPQAVYKRFSSLDESLKRVEDGKKLISKAAEPLFRDTDSETWSLKYSKQQADIKRLEAEKESLINEVDRLKQLNDELSNRIASYEALTADLSARMQEANLLHLNTQKLLKTALNGSQRPARLPLIERIRIFFRGDVPPGR